MKISRPGNIVTDNLPINNSVSVGMTSTEILAINKDRNYAEMRNLDNSQEVFLAFGADAVLNKSVLLEPRESWYMLGNIYAGAINGIVSSGTATVIVLEY